MGLVGLALAAMGARVTITDVDKVLPLMRDNLAANGFDPAKGWVLPRAAPSRALCCLDAQRCVCCPCRLC